MDGSNEIDNFAKAVELYSDYGYEYINLPWEVEDQFAAITCPINGNEIRLVCNNPKYNIPGKQLVASGEQAFLERITKWKIKGTYQTLTPCFRCETIDDYLHQRYFKKLELFDNDFIASDVNIALDHMCKYVEETFKRLIASYITPFEGKIGWPELKFILTPNDDGVRENGLITTNSRDLYLLTTNGEFELGSYGIREFPELGLHWVYGTGLAEPRFSTALGHQFRVNKKL